MLSAERALSLNAEAGKPLPRIEAFEGPHGLYTKTSTTPRHGEVIMIAGRSGTQKSGFALFWVDEMNLPTLYFSADMNAFTASSRLASKRERETTDDVEKAMKMGGAARARILESVADSKITFSFGSPITWQQVDEELEAYVELWDIYPSVMVFDNLMDFDGVESDYKEQMAVMSGLTELARETSSTVIVLHHASDKSWDALKEPWMPPSRDQIKNGLSEKPELTLTVALDADTLEYRVATVKQRMGPSDATARRYASLWCEPALTRFRRFDKQEVVA